MQRPSTAFPVTEMWVRGREIVFGKGNCANIGLTRLKPIQIPTITNLPCSGLLLTAHGKAHNLLLLSGGGRSRCSPVLPPRLSQMSTRAVLSIELKLARTPFSHDK